MKKIILLSLLAGIFVNAFAQQVPLTGGWKFHQGDSAQWSAPQLDESRWKPIDVSRSWESQGYPDYNGFGWYRVHVVISSAIKAKSYLKDSLHIHLGEADDNDEVYLNGKLIGKYGGAASKAITEGNYGPRSYTIAANNPAILWDKDNVIAIRIFDTGGAGGVYGDKFGISMIDIMDYVNINTDGDFTYGPKNSLGKAVKISSKGSSYAYKGKLDFTVTDPENGTVLYQKSNDAAFSERKPFTYNFTIAALQKKSYNINYTFTDAASGIKITKTETTPYLLTPEPSPSPKINGADVYGARPGNPFLYLIPVTGKKPMQYKATGLPTGLTLDGKTGIITGTVAAKGDYDITLTASNSIGTDTKKLTIKIGDIIGLTPALGWNSWNAWGLSVNDEKVRTSASEMDEKLSQFGWSYINIDDGWEADKRAANGDIVANSKFPDMKGLTAYVHHLGLKMGIYSSPGPQTCGGYLGSWQHEAQDAKTYGDWGIDYLKYDWCSYSTVTVPDPQLPDFKKPYQVMRAALNDVHRDIMFSFCQYGMGKVWEWGAEVGGNSWRTTGDIEDTWKSMSGIGFGQSAAVPFAGPGHFNDPDMLVVGKVGWGPSLHNTRLTFDEQYTHISLWSLQAVPLLIGCDMGRLDKFTLNLLTNAEVLAIDQDALGMAATQKIKTDTYQVWVKEMSDGSKAIGIFNTTDKYQAVNISNADAGTIGYKKTRDVWQQKDIATNGTDLKTNIAPHGVMLVRVWK